MRPQFKYTTTVQDGNIGSSSVSTLFTTDSLTLVNQLRHSILSFISTFAVEYVSFDANTTARHDEILALRLGQCPIIQNIDLADTIATIDVEAGSNYRTITTDDILISGQRADIFSNVNPIVKLQPGERLKCQMRFAKNFDHVKFRPVALFRYREVNDGFLNLSLSLTPRVRPTSRLVLTNIRFFRDNTVNSDNVANHRDEERFAALLSAIPINMGNPNNIDDPRDQIEISIVAGVAFDMSQFINEKLDFNIKPFSADINCTCIKVYNDERLITRYRPSISVMNDTDKGFYLEFKSLGMMDANDILETAYRNIPLVLNEKEQNLFLKVER